jgi:hypothetical protein
MHSKTRTKIYRNRSRASRQANGFKFCIGPHHPSFQITDHPRIDGAEKVFVMITDGIRHKVHLITSGQEPADWLPGPLEPIAFSNSMCTNQYGSRLAFFAAERNSLLGLDFIV